MKNIKQITLGILSVAAFLAATTTQALPALTVKDDDFLADVLSEYSLAAETDLNSQGKAYRFAYGVSAVSGTPGTSTYVVSLNASFQQALASAYTNLARTLGTDNIISESSASSIDTTGTPEDVMAECERNKAKTGGAAEEKSMLSLVKGALTAFIDSKEGKDSNKLANVIRCTEITDQRIIEDAIDRGIDDAFSGARVVQTVLHNNYVGVVIAFSPDTSRVAGIITSQQPVSNPLVTARKEIIDWVNDQMASHTGSSLGLIGSRLFKLSNGEWAIVGFGVSSAADGALSGSVLGQQKLITQRNAAQTAAARELARFANSTISSRSKEKITDASTAITTKTEADGVDRIETKIVSSILSRSESIERTSSSLRLKGAVNVYSKRMTDSSTGTDFYLSAHAWSPSMMSSAINFRASADESFRQGQRAVSGNVKSGGDSQVKPTSVPIIEQDW
jgi:hypothetical protein